VRTRLRPPRRLHHRDCPPCPRAMCPSNLQSNSCGGRCRLGLSYKRISTWRALVGLGAPLFDLACLDMVELAGRLAQQHAQELKEVLRLPGDQANEARTKLEALAQALHHILMHSTSGGEERGGDRGTAMEEVGEERSMTEVRWRCGALCTIPCRESLVQQRRASGKAKMEMER
jgi:hypothetical protein